MGGMMGAMGGWVILWTLLALALVAACGIVAARVLTIRHSVERPQLPVGDSPAVREAKDALRLRYAHGEISREEFLQGKVELED
jgi:putative membrane protein